MSSSGYRYLAVDLGAESGRVMRATLSDGQLAVEEVHRFANGPVRLPDGIHWDVLRLWSEIKVGIGLALKSGSAPESIGVDSWGVDFALLDRKGALIGNPYHYRDNRTNGMLEEAFQYISRTEIYSRTGVQFMPINSLYQLLAMRVQESPQLEIAETFLMISDLFHYWLSGEKVNEFTNATTTQCFNPNNREWDTNLLERLGLPTHIFQGIAEPGTPLGDVISDIAEEIGVKSLKVVLPATHDTGSAVAAVPASGPRFAWISSGTWSIVGTEIEQPVINAQAMNFNFTNEGGVQNTWRLSKNVMGLWLVQECRRAWLAEGISLSYEELTKMAREARPFVAVIDPDYPDFLYPGNMPQRILSYCKKTHQALPQTQGEIVRMILESIALKYRWVLERLELLSGNTFDTIHIVGGGSRNYLLNEFTANATGRTVIAGPVEATAIGNAMLQAIGMKHLSSLDEARNVVRASFEPEIYTASASEIWEKPYALLCQLVENHD